MGLRQGEGLLMLFVLRRLTEKFRPKIRSCFFIFVDMEKAFDQGPREVIFFALRRKGIPEFLLDGVMSLDITAVLVVLAVITLKIVVSVHRELSSSFSVKVGVHQESTLSQLLFIMVMDLLTEGVRDSSLMELLFPDDLVLCGESLNEVMGKYGR